MKTKIVACVVWLLAVALLAFPSAADTNAGEHVDWDVVAPGGGTSEVSGHTLHSCVGEPAAGITTSGSITLISGYLQNFTAVTGCCIGIRGDVNMDGTYASPVDLSFLVDFMYNGGPAPPCSEEADLNGDGTSANAVDLAYLVDFMFNGGLEPAACP